MWIQVSGDCHLNIALHLAVEYGNFWTALLSSKQMEKNGTESKKTLILGKLSLTIAGIHERTGQDIMPLVTDCD